jgi:hypothetical protein
MKGRSPYLGTGPCLTLLSPLGGRVGVLDVISLFP